MGAHILLLVQRLAGGTAPEPGRVALARYDGAGRRDPGFGSNGWSAAVDGGRGVLTVDDRGRALVGSDYGATVARFLPSGALDTSFGGDGRVAAPSGSLLGALTTQPDGRVVGANSLKRDASGQVRGVAAFRLLEDGSPDPSFGEGGSVTYDWTDGTVDPVRVVLDDEARVLVHWRRAVLRLLPDGTVDESFGDGGAAPFTLMDGADPHDVVLGADGWVATGAVWYSDQAIFRPFVSRLPVEDGASTTTSAPSTGS